MTSFSYHLSKLLSWLFLCLGFGLEVTGQQHVPRGGACIIASNHISFLDPLVIGVASPVRLTFMARDTLFDNPWLRLWLRSVGAVPLNRDEPDLQAVRRAIRILQSGKPLALFPEGGRQLSGKLGQAKRGVGLLAINAQVPIVPAYVEGTYEVLPPQAKSLRRAKIRVAFGSPIAYTNGLVPSSPPSGAQPEGYTAGGPSLRTQQENLAERLTESWRLLQEQMHAAG